MKILDKIWQPECNEAGEEIGGHWWVQYEVADANGTRRDCAAVELPADATDADFMAMLEA